MKINTEMTQLLCNMTVVQTTGMNYNKWQINKHNEVKQQSYYYKYYYFHY